MADTTEPKRAHLHKATYARDKKKGGYQAVKLNQ